MSKMNNLLLEEVKCPICLDTLRTPIRVLRCGHNLCEECLRELVGFNSLAKCPSCRKLAVLSSSEIEELPRNSIAENIIEIITKEEDSMTFPDIMKQIKNLTEICRRNEKTPHDRGEVFQIIETMMSSVEGSYRLLSAINKAKLLLCSDKAEEAQVACVAIVSVFDGDGLIDHSKKLRDDCENGLQELLDKLLNSRDYDSVIAIFHCRYKFVKSFYKGTLELIKHSESRFRMQELASALSDRNLRKELQQLIIIMEEIVEEMQKTEVCDLKLKCELVASFWLAIGHCCNQAMLYSKAIVTCSQAVTLYKTTFHENACKYSDFGICYNDLGIAFENTMQLAKAKVAYAEGIDIFKKASDWVDGAKKAEAISLASGNLERTFKKAKQKIIPGNYRNQVN